MIQAISLRKSFSNVVAVDGVSLTARPGEILGLLGPNGAGKTTTIRLMLSILQPDAGEILYDGVPFAPPILNTIGYLPEERGLYRKNKLLNTILYFASLKDVSPSQARLRAKQWLDRFELSSYAERKVEELSKGNQQKVQFIIAILHDPQYVILDEPFSGLDPVNQLLLKDELMRLRESGKAVIFSTHIMEHAEKLCDRICLINKGKVILEGALDGVKRDYGENTIHVEFRGDATFLVTMPEFSRALVYQNTAELSMRKGTRPSDVLRLLADRLEITRFEVREPSLESIFLEKVGLPIRPVSSVQELQV